MYFSYVRKVRYCWITELTPLLADDEDALSVSLSVNLWYQSFARWRYHQLRYVM